MKKLLFIVLLSSTLLSTTSIPAWAQEASTQVPKEQEQRTSSPRTGRSSLALPTYGSIVIDWGFDFFSKSPQIDLSFWGSRFVNVYYYHNIRLGQSHFTISPGMGLGFDTYRFKEKDEKYYTLVRGKSSRKTILEDAKERFPDSKEVLQSDLDLRYLDFLIEARFNANHKYPKESFFVAVGGKFGMLWNAFTTVKYEEDDEKKTCTSEDYFNLDKTRYGLHGRIGWGRFGLLYAYTFSRFFKENKGPEKASMNPQHISLSIDLF